MNLFSIIISSNCHLLGGGEEIFKKEIEKHTMKIIKIMPNGDVFN